MARKEVAIAYTPRDAFMPFHNRTQRWACLVAHRRAGKTVAAVNDIIRAAVTCKTHNPLFGYIAPYRSQAKSVAWDYLKRFCKPITKAANEAELQIDLVNNARIRLFGADNADAMRGLGFDGIFMDEYGDFRPSVWGHVIRPTLSDKQGWAVFGGTPKGKNQFWDIYQTAKLAPKEWFLLRLTATDSGILPQSELDAVKAQITTDQYMQEYECSFEAAILGAYYGVEMREASDQGRITAVPYDPSIPTYTAWDLGYRDDTAIWWYQVVRNEIHIIDYYAVSGAGISDIAKVVLEKPYHYGKHYLPHDARAKTLAAQGKSVIEQLAEFLGLANIGVVPDLGVQDGIQAVRMTLPKCWFDELKCHDGIEALRQYEREFDEDKKAFRTTPKHNWCFTGDTKVLTRYGTYQMIDLPYSGEVLTSCGWKQYINPRVTRKNARLVEVTFKDGLMVKCTPDHAFKTEFGWISAEHLTPGTVIQSSLTQLPNILTVAYTAFGKAINTLSAAANTCTETFGKRLLASFQTDAIFITKTATAQTTGFQISNACLPQYIFAKRLLDNQKEHSLKKLALQQQNGIVPTQDVYGTNAMQSVLKVGQNGSVNQKNALNAKTSLMRWFANRGTLKNIVHPLAKLKHIATEAVKSKRQLVIENVKNLNETSDVWCLTVPGAEEFSLQNGALVHNCSHPADAFRMMAIAWRGEDSKKIVAFDRPLIVGPGNTATLNDMWAANKPKRRARL